MRNFNTGKDIILLFTAFFFCLMDATAQIYGCTDPLALNYKASAIINDGSCIYNTAAIAGSTA